METLDCRDHSCWFALDQSGQRTNGGCRCLRDIPTAVRSKIIRTLQLKVGAEKERCAQMIEAKGYNLILHNSDNNIAMMALAEEIRK